MSGTVPIVMSASGAVPRTPATLLNLLLTLVAASNPGYTADLPGGLIEDISSTDVAALGICDTALVDLVNSVTPYGVNEFLLTQLGNVYGVAQQSAYNTSVYVVFTGPAGYVIPIGFIVSDGTYQYIVQDGAIIGSGDVTGLVYCLAMQTGSWAVPAGSVTTRVTSVPTTISLSVTNPGAGTPSAAAESYTQYRVRVLQSGLATAQGVTTFLKTQLQNITGVQARLVSVRQSTTPAGWEVICGGGDPYQIAYAIFQSLFDLVDLVGSTLFIGSVTLANPGVVTTVLNHGYATGQAVTINGAQGMTELNGNTYTIIVITETTFSIGVNTSGYTAYTEGGICTPNFRNVVVNINDYPDTYAIPFVSPPQQLVTMSVTWNTNSLNYVSPAAVAQLAQPALVSYINNLAVGQPINVDVMIYTFQTAVASLLQTQLIDRLVFSVSINGVGASPASGTCIISGDPESYFETNAAGTGIVITQG